MKITKKITHEIIFENDSNTMKDCVINAILSDANLRDADLRDANLRDADLRDADLRGAYLGGADLGGADLRVANLRDSDLRGAFLCGAKDIPFIPLSCPSDGEFIGWKKVSNKFVRLLIPSDARSSSSTSNKCRCDKAKVLEITDLDGSNPITSVINNNNFKTQYVVGEMVFPDSFDENRWNECSHGIYFFINKQEAINY